MAKPIKERSDRCRLLRFWYLIREKILLVRYFIFFVALYFKGESPVFCLKR